MRYLFGLLLLAFAMNAGVSPAGAEEPPLKLGVLTDMTSGFSSWSGKGSVIAAQMAVEDFQKQNGALPFKVEVIFADHQNKADVATNIVRKWLDDDVNAVLDAPNSATALAANFLLRGSKAAFLISGGGHDALTRKECSPNNVQWTFDLWSLARNTSSAAIARGADSWFFITANYAGGQGLEAVATKFVTAAGGQVLGHTLPALSTLDYSSFLLQAQASKAKIVGFAMAGGDLMTAIKQAGEFGIVAGGQKLVALAVFLNDVHGLGLKAANGLIFTTAFYWDMDDGKRAFAKRFAELDDGNYPSDVQAGVYSTVLHYLKAVVASKSRLGPEVVAKMKELPTDDPLFGKGRIRSDGRGIHDMFVVEVKTPAESKGPWDLLKVIDTIPGDKAFAPPSPEDCPLAK